MRKITFIFFFLFSAISFAQFSADDVKFFVGTGEQTAYLVIDFKDGTDDRSYAWGIRFDENNPLTGLDALELLATEEPNFIYEQTGGFLDRLAFNAHDSYEMEYDFWSLWTSLDGNTWNMNGWMSSDLVDGTWYGASYGFGMGVPGPDAPITPIPAYSSQWFSNQDIDTWIGSGTAESLVIIDFGTTTNAIEDSYVFGIKHNGSITAEEALDLISASLESFSYELQGEMMDITLNNHIVNQTIASIYKGTDLSNWVTQTSFHSTTLTDGEWLGLSFGDRRPYIPQDGHAFLGHPDFNKIQLNIYPNPATNFITIEVEEDIQVVKIYALSGAQVMQTHSNEVNISNLSKGMYFLEVTTTNGRGMKKIIKK